MREPCTHPNPHLGASKSQIPLPRAAGRHAGGRGLPWRPGPACQLAVARGERPEGRPRRHGHLRAPPELTSPEPLGQSPAAIGVVLSPLGRAQPQPQGRRVPAPRGAAPGSLPSWFPEASPRCHKALMGAGGWRHGAVVSHRLRLSGVNEISCNEPCHD